ncbi:hypothetical protein [Roseomonas sp. HF4]|nr:hypothetical protein [Roseomonas sp. HF4]
MTRPAKAACRRQAESAQCDRAQANRRHPRNSAWREGKAAGWPSPAA